jgi:hypothetical protein
VISKGFFIYFCPNRQIIVGFVIKLYDSVLETTESLNKSKGAFNTHRNAYSDVVASWRRRSSLAAEKRSLKLMSVRSTSGFLCQDAQSEVRTPVASMARRVRRMAVSPVIAYVVPAA